ncbi:MAG: GAF domain-containing protein, partial [Chloroflexi bacterium]|nr:GAF domain-containing protein [Chloroflexota bacterium]
AQLQHVLERRVEERTRELQALLEVSRDVASTLDLDRLLYVILAQLKSVIDYSTAAILIAENDDIFFIDHLGPAPRTWMSQLGIRPEQLVGYQEVLRRREPVIVADFGDGSPLAVAFREASRKQTRLDWTEVRSWLGVPLLAKDRWLGTLNLRHAHAGYYTAEHAELATAIASQAAIAIENARLYHDLEGRLARLHTLTRLNQLVSSSLEIDEVLREIAKAAAYLMDATVATFWLVDETGERMHVRAFSDEVLGLDFVPRTIRFDERAGAWIGALREPLHVPNVFASSTTLGHRDWWWVHGLTSFYAIPIVDEDQLVAVLALSGQTPFNFSADHQELLEAFVAQTALALRNARLYSDLSVAKESLEAELTERRRIEAALAERSRRLEAVRSVTQEITRELDLTKLLSLIVQRSAELIGVKTGAVYIWDDEAACFAVRAIWGAAGWVKDHRPGMGVGITGRVGQNRQGMIVNDYASAEGADPAVLDRTGFTALLSEPLLYRDRVVGVITLSNRDALDRSFTEEDRELLSLFADQAAVSIENARLFGEAQGKAALEERQRLARELHDSVSQALYGIALGARTARTMLDRDPVRSVDAIDYVLSLADAGLTEMRALIFELRPESLETEGLVAALHKQAASVRARHGITVAAELGEEPAAPFPVKEALYRIAQEALHNTVKHARARNVALRLERNESGLRLVVADDGQGFDPHGSFPGHLGLESMRERATRLGGSVDLHSTPGEGTRITTVIPVGP